MRALKIGCAKLPFFYLQTVHLFNVLVFIIGAQQSITDAVHLSLDVSMDLSVLGTSEGCISSAKQADIVDTLEEMVAVWCQQIEHVLAEGSQMRKEADDSGK